MLYRLYRTWQSCRSRLRISRWGVSVTLAAALFTGHAMAAGGYVTYQPPSGIPSLVSQVSYYFTMQRNPGRTAFAFYGQNFTFQTSAGGSFGGYIGLVSGEFIPGKDTYAMLTLWPPQTELVSLQPGSNATCSQAPLPGGGYTASCSITASHPLADKMQNGHKFRLYVNNTSGKTYSFGIENTNTGANYVIGTMTFQTVTGINSSTLSHVLDYLAANNAYCGLLPQTEYRLDAPKAVANGTQYTYTVVAHQNPLVPCANNVTFAANNSWGQVQFSLDQNLYRPSDLGCHTGDPCLLNTREQAIFNFQTQDANWSRNIYLPSANTVGNSISIASTAAYWSHIMSQGKPGPSLKFTFGTIHLSRPLTLFTNDQFAFANTGTAADAAWTPGGSSFLATSPNESGQTVPASHRLIYYRLMDGNWLPDIILPGTGLANQMVIIHSDATYQANIRASASGPVLDTLTKGSTFVYEYNGGWTKVTFQ